MKEFITWEDIVTTIYMIRAVRNRLVILVEGEKDLQLYQKLVDPTKCEIVPTYGRENLLRILAALEKGHVPGILAIVDADFDVLEGKFPASPNLLFTDGHDLETMILKSPAFENLLNEYGSQRKIEKLRQTRNMEMREILLETAMPVGYLLWLSLRENLALRFENLKFKKFIDKNTLLIDKDKLIQKVKINTFSNGYINPTRRQKLLKYDIYSNLERLYNSGHDPWHVCRGHDLVQVLSLGLCKAMGSCRSQDVQAEELESKLRLAFESSHFRKTQLYLAILDWEKANAPYLAFGKHGE